MQFVLSQSDVLARAFWMRRNLLGAIPDAVTQEEKDNALSDGSRDIDASSRLQSLLQRMTTAFVSNGNPNAVRTYEVSVDAYVADPSNLDRQAYFVSWKRDITSMLMTEVTKVVDKKRQWNLDGCGLGIGGDDVGEMLHHYSWAREKCLDFEGREDLLGRALACIRSENRAKNKGLLLKLVLYFLNFHSLLSSFCF